ncbi:MAG: hypothetical protein IH931_08050, partial [candidate division Zixibacteria bacterium]|nr:hypothetical protein [candidate division Zixibacteria bacterium]
GVTIDGIPQHCGATCEPSPPSTAVLLIEISGGAAGPTPGLWLLSDFNHIRGLVINEFQEDGIRIEGGVAGPTANFNVITCCFIGTDLSGTIDKGNGTNMGTLYGGVRIKNVPNGFALDNVVEDCLLSGNYADGATIWGPIVPGDVGLNTIISCYIGTDITGSVALGNDNEGVSMVEGTHDNVVTRNLISGNGFDGVGIQGFNNIGFGPPIISFSNHVVVNRIGVSATSLSPIPNLMRGVAIGTYGPAVWGCAAGNFIERNIIAENKLEGVYVLEDAVDVFNADENLISENSIYNNGGLGIDLQAPGVTANDPGDPDVLANDEMNFPVIDSAKEAAGTTTIYGKLDTPAPMSTTVEVFKARLDPSGHGEGEIYLGSTTPNAGGLWFVAVTGLIVGDSVTSTATDAANNTSEFSKVRAVKGSSCCIGIRGDCNTDGVDANILDLTFLVDFIFRGSGNPGSCPKECDVNSDGASSNILDLTFLVDRIFRGGPLPGPC